MKKLTGFERDVAIAKANNEKSVALLRKLADEIESGKLPLYRTRMEDRGCDRTYSFIVEGGPSYVTNEKI